MNNNVVNLFPPKISAIPEGQTMDESVEYFHSKLDAALADFSSMSVMEKWELFESVCSMNKSIFKLYMDLKKQSDFNREWYSGLSDKLANALEQNKEKDVE